MVLVTQAAQQRLVGMRMGIDQAGQGHHAERIEGVVVGSTLELPRLADFGDRLVLHDDGCIGDNAAALIHRHDGGVLDQKPGDGRALPIVLLFGSDRL